MADPATLQATLAADDVPALEKLLRERPELLDAPLDDRRRTPMHLAAQADARGAAEALLKAGGDFYARDENGQLPLDLPPGEAMNGTRRWLRAVNQSRNDFLGAVHARDAERVKALLAGDPSLARARDIGDGWSAVMMACHFGDAETLRALLAAGAPIDAADFHTGHDAVYVCADKGNAELLGLLVDAGADLHRVWRVGYGSLPMRMNALHVAAWKGHAGVVRRLLDAKLDPNERAKSYAVFSPLHLAATDGHAEVVRMLLDAGADRDARDGRRGITALEMAEAGKHEAVAALLRAR